MPPETTFAYQKHAGGFKWLMEAADGGGKGNEGACMVFLGERK